MSSFFWGLEAGRFVRHQHPAGGEDQPLRGFPRCRHVVEVPEPMALEQRHLEAELLHVFHHDCLGGLRGPVHHCLDILSPDLRENAREVRGVLVVDLGDDDGDSAGRGKLFKLRLSALSEAGVAGQDADAAKSPFSSWSGRSSARQRNPWGQP